MKSRKFKATICLDGKEENIEFSLEDLGFPTSFNASLDDIKDELFVYLADYYNSIYSILHIEEINICCPT